MKYLITLILSINTALACRLSIPESYVPTFLNPPVNGHYEKCEDKPEEKCHCVETIDPWASKLDDNLVVDYTAKLNEVSCESEVDCDEKFLTLVCTDSVAIKNYDLLQVYCAKEIMKVEGKKLVVDEAKKAAFETDRKAKEDEATSKKELRRARKAELKVIDWSASMTTAQLKGLLRKVIEAQE